MVALGMILENIMNEKSIAMSIRDVNVQNWSELARYCLDLVSIIEMSQVIKCHYC